MDKELECMTKITEALSSIDDVSVIKRILAWTTEKYLGGGQSLEISSPSPTEKKSSIERSAGLDGIAMLTANGELKITARDLKGKSANDKALRLAHIVLYAHHALTGEKWASSRKILTPILKDHRLYTGNSRRVLAQHKGIVRDGDLLTLDSISRSEAERIMEEIRATN